MHYIMTPDIVVLGLRAGFIATPLSGCIPLTVTLIDTSTKNSSVISKVYNMGNGAVFKVTSDTMYYTYKKTSSPQDTGFTIELIVSNGTCIDTVRKQVYPKGPFGQISAFNNSNCDSVNYTFIPGANGIKPFHFFWDLGNGDTTSTYGPTHTFTPGFYRVKLKVTDSTGCSDTLSTPIKVTAERDSANFIIDMSIGTCPPFIASFIDKSKFSVPGIHYYKWDFGDGSTSKLQFPSKIYNAAGSYTISLTVKDELGCTSTIVKPNVIVIKGPTGIYSFDSKGD